MQAERVRQTDVITTHSNVAEARPQQRFKQNLHVHVVYATKQSEPDVAVLNSLRHVTVLAASHKQTSRFMTRGNLIDETNPQAFSERTLKHTEKAGVCSIS